jgi:isopentenyl phosphate kinase
MFIVKFGGSVITDKTKKYTFEKEAATRLVSEILDSSKKTLVVHGAGSFGHILAKKHKLHEGYKSPDQIKAVSEVQRDVRHLNLMVLNTFLEYGINAVSLAPSSFLTNKSGKIEKMDTALFKRYFEMGFTPITFGDVVLDDDLQFSICSGDSLMLELARAFKPKAVIFVTDVDGIYSSDPSSSDEARLLEVVNEDSLKHIKRGESRVDDVTGSIFGKLDVMFQIAALGLKTIIINGTVEERLKGALKGEDILCTRIHSKV